CGLRSVPVGESAERCGQDTGSRRHPAPGWFRVLAAWTGLGYAPPLRRRRLLVGAPPSTPAACFPEQYRGPRTVELSSPGPPVLVIGHDHLQPLLPVLAAADLG